jgi:hypothetical protein
MRPDPSGQLAGYLANNREAALVDLYTFVTTGGETIRCSGTAVPVSVPATMFDSNSANAGAGGPVAFALGPRFGRSKLTTKVGLQVDTMDLDIYAGQGDLLGSNYTWQQSFYWGVFDMATVELGRLICQPQPGGGLGPPVGYVVWFQGLVGQVDFGRTAIKVAVNSKLTLLNTQYPRRLWQHTCSHVFGDAMCQFDRQSLAMTVQAQANSTQFAINTGVSPNPFNLYNDGTIVGLSGANTNIKRTIYNLVNGIVDVVTPFIYPVAVNDYFTILPGCDRTVAMCQGTFNNLQHYGGQPYIVHAEFAV